MPEQQPSADVETRVDGYTEDSHLGWVSAALTARRDEILERWLEAAAAQPCHHGRRQHAVADHIPSLFDALVAFMQRAAPRAVAPGAPLDDPGILAAAESHALMRTQHGLQPAEVVTEFRLLRQEIWRALRLGVTDGAPTSDVVGAELLLNDALDGAISCALAALTEWIERVREEFLATTVHEVRRPVTRIKGYAQLADQTIVRPQPDIGRVRLSLRRVLEATDQMSTLLNTLVESSRIALGGLVLEPSRSDLAALVRDAIAQLTPEAAVRVTLETAAGFDTSCECDAARLEEVLGNLLTNAAQYSPPDTPITVAIEGDAATLKLSVRDQGIGVSSGDLPDLFERYARGRNAIDQHIEGLGLGLYLCRGIVVAHGGRIWAESPGPGRGTTIHVDLPREGPTSPSEE